MTGPVTAPAFAVGPGTGSLENPGRPAAAPRPGPTAARAGIPGLHAPLAAAARQHAPQLPAPALDSITSAAVAMVARDGLDAGVGAAAGMAAAAAAVQRATVPTVARQPVDWTPFGVVIPVLAGSPGSGASVVAATMADALQIAGRCVLLADAADPARSGLADAAAAEGLTTRRIHDGLTVRYSWRHAALLARLESPYPIVPAMVPPPPGWLPTIRPVHATVVDVGHDGWRAAADPLAGAGCWLRRGHPVPRPMLVVRATRPSLLGAEQVLARLHRWVTAGVATPAAQLVVAGARRWPRRISGVAGRLLAGLLDDAVFLPRHPDIETGGVTADLVPRQLRSAVTPLLQDWQLLDAPPPKGRR
jgi:hypothetical protein